VWHEKWGEDYAKGGNACLKWTDRWSETLLEGGAQRAQGDKWREEFADGTGNKTGETWFQDESGHRCGRWGARMASMHLRACAGALCADMVTRAGISAGGGRTILARGGYRSMATRLPASTGTRRNSPERTITRRRTSRSRWRSTTALICSTFPCGRARPLCRSFLRVAWTTFEAAVASAAVVLDGPYWHHDCLRYQALTKTIAERGVQDTGWCRRRCRLVDGKRMRVRYEY
jgi:hypothetical protein